MESDARATEGGRAGAGARRSVALVCVGDRPGDLIAGLSRRGVSAQVVGDAPAAMVALAAGAKALIVVEPARLAATPALLAAAARYFPAAAQRLCQPGPDGSRLTTPGEPPATPRRTGERVAGPTTRARQEEHVQPSALLTAEELAMLLSPIITDDAEQDAAAQPELAAR